MSQEHKSLSLHPKHRASDSLTGGCAVSSLMASSARGSSSRNSRPHNRRRRRSRSIVHMRSRLWLQLRLLRRSPPLYILTITARRSYSFLLFLIYRVAAGG